MTILRRMAGPKQSLGSARSGIVIMGGTGWYAVGPSFTSGEPVAITQVSRTSFFP